MTRRPRIPSGSSARIICHRRDRPIFNSQFDPDMAGEFNTGIETFREERKERGEPIPE
jgi:hypothetical protein